MASRSGAPSHPVFARVYARMGAWMDHAGVLEHRRRLAAGLSGRVIEVGAGNGLMFAHYPLQVTEVVAVEPEPRLRQAAQVAARSAAVPIRVVEGIAEALPGADGEFDAAVSALVLCTVPDPLRALTEIARLVRPGGQLRFLEHVAADRPGAMRRVQAIADATVWPLLLGGCHTGRDTLTAIRAAGFAVEECERFRFPPRGPAGPAAPMIRGVAVRPAEVAS